MTIHKCDRCGEIIENYYDSPREYYIRKIETNDFKADYGIDLCDDCYKQFLSWMQGMNLISDTRIEAAESVGLRRGNKMAEDKFMKERPEVS